MKARGNRDLAELAERLDADEQWRQLNARHDRRRWAALIVGAVILGLALYLGGVLWTT